MKPVPVSPSKRVFDILMSGILLLLLSPFVSIFLLLSVIEQIIIPASRGSLLYKEIRISQGKPFTLWKIRTLKSKPLAEAKANGIVHTKKLERISSNFTFMGFILHQIYLDETPQLFSVLKGDMSLVGPRPTNISSYEAGLRHGHIAKKILKAGLTGRFQTRKHIKYNLNQEQVDMEYARLCTERTGLQIVIYDLYILLQTAVTVLRAEGL